MKIMEALENIGILQNLHFKKILKDWGTQGVGVAIGFMSIMTRENNYPYPTEDLDLIADELKSSNFIVSEIVKNSGLFSVVVIEEKEHISCQILEQDLA